MGFSSIAALAFDAATGTLYGVDEYNDEDELVRIDTTTGAITTIGPIGSIGSIIVEGLAFDPDTNILYGVDPLARLLLTIDTATGAGTVVGSTWYPDIRSLAFIPNDPVLGDCTRDGVVNLFDSRKLVKCIQGPNQCVGVRCGCFDFDGDVQITLRDFADLQVYFGNEAGMR